MRVIILAGGLGTRLSEYTNLVPKPMVKVGERPLLFHIMQIFAKYGHKDFIIALGYKGEVIKEYFVNYKKLNSNFSLNLQDGEIKYLNSHKLDWDVSLIDTGLNTLTGGRIKRLREQINNQKFLLTYGDGLADIDINSLINFHNNHGKLVTLTAVRPSARFGELDIKDCQIKSFKEKPQLNSGWVNGGFMVMEPDFLDLIEDDDTMLERGPLNKASEMGELMAFCHEGFWQCVDNKRDLDFLNEMVKNAQAPWIK